MDRPPGTFCRSNRPLVVVRSNFQKIGAFQKADQYLAGQPYRHGRFKAGERKSSTKSLFSLTSPTASRLETCCDPPAKSTSACGPGLSLSAATAQIAGAPASRVFRDLGTTTASILGFRLTTYQFCPSPIGLNACPVNLTKSARRNPIKRRKAKQSKTSNASTPRYFTVSASF